MTIGRKVWRLAAFAVVLLFIALQGNAMPWADGSHGGFCKASSRAMLEFDLLAAKSDCRLEVAKGLNIADPEEREEFLEEAKEAFEEAKEEAWERYEMRLMFCKALGGEPYDPEIDPEDFVDVIDNTYLPLIPGTTLVYEGETEDGLETIVVEVTDETKEIMGVECTVVRDTVTLDGEVIEDTYDWFAQDVEGNVWYFGELSMEFEDGELVALEGSWKAGEDGAKPGIVMLANPQLWDIYRQEMLLSEAEDGGAVIGLNETVEIGIGTFADCLKTLDFTPIEPWVFENKFYAPGIGVVLEVNLEDDEQVELVEIIVD